MSSERAATDSFLALTAVTKLRSSSNSANSGKQPHNSWSVVEKYGAEEDEKRKISVNFISNMETF